MTEEEIGIVDKREHTALYMAALGDLEVKKFCKVVHNRHKGNGGDKGSNQTGSAERNPPVQYLLLLEFHDLAGSDSKLNDIPKEYKEE